ncbi:MAG: tetratricopeptide repeat protein [Arenimonas sp.]
MSDSILSALRGGDAAQALALADALLAEAPEQAEAHYWRALALQTLRRGDEAQAAIDRAIELAPGREDFALTRSVMRLGGKDPGETQAGLMDALAFNPNHLPAYIGLIHIALGQNNPAEAKRLLKLAERVDADDADVLAAKGAIAQAEGALDDAIALFTRALERAPQNVLALGGLAFAYMHKQMPVFAEQALRRAIALAPDNARLRRGLVDCLLRQERPDEAEQALDELLAQVPADSASLGLRIRFRQARGDFDGALADARALLDAAPDDLSALTQCVSLLVRTGAGDEARAVVAAALQRDQGNDALWQLSAGLEAGLSGDGGEVIARWLQRLPDSAVAHEAAAVHHEAKGDLDAAAAEAEAALALRESLPLAQFVKLRQEVRTDPQAALARIRRLAQVARTPEAERMVLAWTGLVQDRLGRYDEAAAAFSRMAEHVLPAKTLPTPYPARDVPAPDAEGRLLWTPAGFRAERVFNALAPILGNRLLVDRNQPSPAREDGFGAFRHAPGSEFAGSAAAWKAGIRALGLQPAEVVDWLPQWDGYTAAALAGTELTAVVIDPRDALLNWLVFGSAQSYVFLPRLPQSAKWLAACYQMLADTVESGPQTVHVIKADALDDDAASIAAALQAALALDSAPDAGILGTPIMALGGMPNQFPAGHWRHYKDAFAEAFAELAPVAVRLGYPQD